MPGSMETTDKRPGRTPRSRSGAGTAPKHADQDLREALALYETTQEICSRLDLEETLGAIVRRSREMLGTDVAYLATHVVGRDILRMRAFDQVRSARFMALDLPYGFGLGGLVAARRGPVSTDDYVGDLELEHNEAVDEIVREEGIRSVLGVPVDFEHELLGVLFVATRRRKHFTTRQRTLLSSLGNSAAIAIHNAQLYEEIKRAMTIHQNLMGVVLADKGLPGVATTLADLIEAPVLLLDSCAQPLASAAYASRNVPALERQAVERAIRQAASLPASTRHGAMDLTVNTVTLGEAVEGYLVVEQKPHTDGLFNVALEQASTVFALELAKVRSVEMAELHLRGDLLDQLLSDGLRDEPALIRQASRLGHDLTGPHHVAVARLRSDGRGTGSTIHNRLLQVALTLLRRQDPASLVAWKADALVLLIPGGGLESSMHLAQELVREGRTLAGANLAVGVSSVTSDLAELKLGYAQALTAAGAAASLPGLGSVVAFGQLGFRRAVLGTRPSSELKRLAEGALSGLLEPEDARTKELLPALRAYLAVGGSAEAAARTAGIHVNTMRYRLDRIASILKCDLKDTGTRLDLQMALDVLG